MSEFDDDPAVPMAQAQAAGCIDDVAQAIGKNIHEQLENTKPEPNDKPAVPCVHKPDGDDVKQPAEVVAAIGLTSLNPDDKKFPAADGNVASKSPTTDGTVASPPGRSFPEILYEIISDPATDDICGWLPHGNGFVINDKDRFGKEILPKYFDGTKYTSFTRRLKRWSFTRIARGAELGAYYNENFVRDSPTRVLHMKYRVVHGDVVGAAAATMACGGTAQAATAAALAAAAMIQEKKRAGKRGKAKGKKDDMTDGMFPPHGMMDPRYNMQPWNNYGNMMPMNMMTQQYFQMMAQSFAAHQGAFNNYMNSQNPNNNRNNGDGQNSNNGNQDPNNMFQNQYQGNMPYFPYGMMPPNMNVPSMPQQQPTQALAQQGSNPMQQQEQSQQNQAPQSIKQEPSTADKPIELDPPIEGSDAKDDSMIGSI